MSESIPDLIPLGPERDGTSQSQRILPSLDPETVSLDGRSLQDCLVFAQAYAKELTYFNLEAQPCGDWQGLLNPNGLNAEDLTRQWREIPKFLAEPETFDHTRPYRRPHFLLFVIFLHLLGLTRQRINQLTRKHLDFYYQTYLSLTKQAGRPDRVNILAKLTADTAQTRLPAGTLLLAGQDSRGDELYYRTDAELIVNRAQVKRLSSVFVDMKITGIREARESCLESNADPLLAMFAIVYGEPTPGDSLPPYPVMESTQTVEGDFLDLLKKLVDFVSSRLHMEFQQFHTMMRLKNQRMKSAVSDWTLINDKLNIIGVAKWGSTYTKISPPDSTKFDDNIKHALNEELNYSELGGDITSMEDLYRQSYREEVRKFIKKYLFLELDDFNTMMKKKMEVDADWRHVNSLLKFANPNFVPKKPASPEFYENVKTALGVLDFSGLSKIFAVNNENENLDRFHAALNQVEAYFHCRLEDFAQLMDARARDKIDTGKPTPAEWESAYAILAKAYSEKVYASRRVQLIKFIEKKDTQVILEAMLRLVLGESRLTDVEMFSRLTDYWPKEANKESLEFIKNVIVDNKKDIPLPSGGWTDIVANLELTWRNREGKEPVAQKVEWLNLYANEDATAMSVPNPMGTQQRWRTFGQFHPSENRHPTPLLGWSIASPVFLLSQGSRKVELTLNFQPTLFDQKRIDSLRKHLSPDYLQIEASTAKGWVVPNKLIKLIADKDKDKVKLGLKLDLSLDESFPPIAALPGAESPWPLIRLMLLGKLQEQAYVMPLYPLMQDLVLEQVLIKVTVAGLSDLHMENDEGSLSAGKPFEPFGSNLSVGSGFLFTHPELVTKRLDKLSAKLEWMKLPFTKLTDIKGYYKNYLEIETDPFFSAKLSLVDHRLEIKLLDKAGLFSSGDAKDCTIEINDVPQKIDEIRKGYAYLPEFGPFSEKGPSSWSRYWRFELNKPDFQHGNYARVSAATSLKWAAAIAASIKNNTPPPNPEDYQVNPPYTPKLKSFSVGYECSVKIIMNHPVRGEDGEWEKPYGNGEERMFHLHAFGYAEIQPKQNAGLHRFLPAYGNAGELYIGLEAVAVPQDVAILFQMADGSANPDVPPQPVQWSYLSGNHWVSLHDGGILADSTGRLVESGIIKFRLPKAEPNTLLPANLYWLRVAVAQYCDSICDTVAIHTQAVTATWVDRGNAPDHLERALPPRTINRTPDAVSGLLSISQPYSSYGGKPGEQDALFNTRVSERLRHKQRALTYWDYEYLILKQFPDIYKAKCIPSPLMEPSELGKVEVVVIPDIRDRQPFNPFEPKATARQITEITGFLSSHAPPLAEIKVKNAHYVPVRVRFAVRFMPSCDPGFYKPRLNEDLNRFLSPWAYAESNEVTIGGKIYANAIVEFLDRRPYVDYVAGIKLFKNEDGRRFILVEQKKEEADEGYHVQTDRRDGVLVADRQHEIDLITDIRFHEEKFTGIGYLKIELDFIIKE